MPLPLGKFYPCQFSSLSYIFLIKMSIHNFHFVAFPFYPELASHHSSQLPAGARKLADRAVSCLQVVIVARKAGPPD